MSAVRSFLGAVWSYGVSLPLYVMWSLIVSSVRAAFDFFYPRGYRPCNELADTFVEECANRPAGQPVRLPWVNSSATHSLVMNNTGRLLSYVAVASGWFGVAVKNCGTQYQPKRTYRYYYRRSLTGNWFAEIWSVPKSGFIAAALAVPFVDMARDVMRGRTFVKQDSFSIGEWVPLPGYEGLILLMAGLLLVICFLPRAILGRGTHFAAIAPVNGGFFGGYGCAQVINWAAAMAGFSYLWLAMGAEWNVGAVVNLITSEVAPYWGDIQDGIGKGEIINTLGFLFVGIPVIAAIGCVVATASIVLPAAAFWYISLRFMAARKAKAQLEALPYNSTQAAMYLDSDFEKVAELRAPQVFLGFVVYVGVLLGIVLYPIATSITGQAWAKHGEIEPDRWDDRASAYFNQSVPSLNLRPDQEYHLQVVEGGRKNGRRVCEVRAFISGREIAFRESRGNPSFGDTSHACNYIGVHIRYSKAEGYKVATNSMTMLGVDVLAMAKSLGSTFFTIYL